MAIKFRLPAGSSSSKKISATSSKRSRFLAESPPPCPRPPKGPLKLLTADHLASPSRSMPGTLPTRNTPTGKEFFFKELPRELRDMIYSFCIGEEQPSGNFARRNTKIQKQELRFRRWISLLLVCRQAHAEFAPLLYEAAHFTFNLGYLESQQTISVRFVHGTGNLWEVSELLMQNLQQCTIKVEAGWFKDKHSRSRWNSMAEEITRFLTSLPKLHTLYVYVNRSNASNRMIRSDPQYKGFRTRQVAALNAVRSAFRLNPAIQELNITERLGLRDRAYCRLTSILALTDGSVAEESYLGGSKYHLKYCEIQCTCRDGDFEHEEDDLFKGRDELPKAWV